MKVLERLKSLARRIGNPDQELKKLRENDPNNILDLLIYHRITSYAGETAGIKSFRKLKNSFVDWNEVRISPIPEIQKALGSAAPSSLAVAVFIKDLLDFLHHQRHILDLEFLAEENNTQIRRFMKKIKGIDAAAIDVVLNLRREYRDALSSRRKAAAKN